MNALETQNLTKIYPGFTLDHVGLTLPGGCVLGLIGENGAGKSTLIKLILEVIHRNEGSVTILNHPCPEELRLAKEDVGVVLDEVGLPLCVNARQVGTILAATYRTWDSESYRQLLCRLSVPEKTPFKDLSKGMKMKLGIAAALAHSPKLLILDEATAGLDPVAREEVVELLREFVRDENHSIFISSHIVSDLEKLCDYIAFLHKGKLLLLEEKDRLLEEYGMVLGSRGQVDALPEDGVKARRSSLYGDQALVLRERMPAGIQVRPISLEELFVFMVKEEVKQ